MASRPLQLIFNAAADALGEELIFDAVADGETIASIVQRIHGQALAMGIADSSGAGFSRPMFYGWLDDLDHGPAAVGAGGETRRDRFARARQQSGTSHVDRAQGKIEQASPVTAALARTQADFHRWLAGKLDSQYAEKQGPNVVISLGAQHLDALRVREENPHRSQLAAGQGDVVDAEVVEE